MGTEIQNWRGDTNKTLAEQRPEPNPIKQILTDAVHKETEITFTIIPLRRIVYFGDSPTICMCISVCLPAAISTDLHRETITLLIISRPLNGWRARSRHQKRNGTNKFWRLLWPCAAAGWLLDVLYLGGGVAVDLFRLMCMWRGLKSNPKLAHTERICSFVLRTPEISIRPVIWLVSDCGQRVLNKAIGVLVITRVVSLIQQRLIYDRDHPWPR